MFSDNRQPVVESLPANATPFDVFRAVVCNTGSLCHCDGMLLVCRRKEELGVPCRQNLALFPHVHDASGSAILEPCAVLRNLLRNMSSAMWSLSGDASWILLPAAVLSGLRSSVSSDMLPRELLEQVHIFVDGSAMAGIGCPRAGASFKVWAHAADGSVQLLGYHTSRVLIEGQDERDAACVAECQALAYAIVRGMACPLKVRHL